MLSYEEILQMFHQDTADIDSYIDWMIYDMLMRLIFD